ncbi:MAG: hypothetical protein JNJ73_12770 [Hyphomonadaceae bacterium]|nr:hypothetical protein [Hyphomonadaceae bacterium]
MRVLLMGLAFLAATSLARADETSDGRALAARFMAVSDVAEQLRAGARASLENTIARRLPDASEAERAAMAGQVAGILTPILDRRMPAILEAVNTALAAEFSAGELQQLIDMQGVLQRPDVARAVAAAQRARTDGARIQALAAIPSADFERVLLFLGSPMARRVEATLRTVAQGLSRDMAGEALTALARACAPETGGAPRWCHAMPAQ